VSYNTQIALCQHNSSCEGICARRRGWIFNVYVVLQAWAGTPAAVRLVRFRGVPSNRFNPRGIPAVSRSRNEPLDNSRYNMYYLLDAFRRIHDFHPQKQ
jgi:hypothetical protein